ncbi:ATP-grasp domain-containing protein, partial [Candidatus Micrarchaeota archaeon]|nr:ATP-grasp domain-containing protein [Candidatus Micrarchaeota archaeon]
QIPDAKAFSAAVGYPVLIRPSYVLSGAAMNVAFEEKDLEVYLSDAASVNAEYPVVISKFITNSKEIEIDAVAKNGEIVAKALSEHLENAGVHSGDATLVYPAKSVYVDTARKAEEIAEKIARALDITGPFNIQFLAKGNDVKVIECNLRASRSFPFVSKVSKHNFIDAATRAIMGAEVPKKFSNGIKHVGVKAPQFSFSRLKGADPILRVEMASTGEVACLGADLHEAFLKSIMATGFKLPKNSVVLSIGSEENRYKLMDSILILDEMGFEIYATKNTSAFLNNRGIENKLVKKIHEKDGYNALDLIRDRKVDLVINIPSGYSKEQLDDQYSMRRKAVDYGIALITNMQLAKIFIEAIYRKKPDDLKVKSWDEYH